MDWLSDFIGGAYRMAGPVGGTLFLGLLLLALFLIGLCFVRPRQGVTWIDSINEYVGRIVSWTALAMVLIQFVVVILRYVFAVGSIPVQESILYCHAILFLLGAGYTLKYDGHVRVDVFYGHQGPKGKAAIDLIGVIVLLLPATVAFGYWSWSFILQSWQIHEGSKEPLGLHLVYISKTLILPFAVLVSLQGLALAVRSVLVLSGRLETNASPAPGAHPPPDSAEARQASAASGGAADPKLV